MRIPGSATLRNGDPPFRLKIVSSNRVRMALGPILLFPNVVSFIQGGFCPSPGLFPHNLSSQEKALPPLTSPKAISSFHPMESPPGSPSCIPQLPSGCPCTEAFIECHLHARCFIYKLSCSILSTTQHRSPLELRIQRIREVQREVWEHRATKW